MAGRFGSLTAAREKEINRFLRDANAAARVARQVQNYVNNVGILCLSEVGNLSTLWKEYGDNGRGGCLWLDTFKVANDEHYRDPGPFEVTHSDAPRRPWNPRGTTS
jgi:hypothetical protein